MCAVGAGSNQRRNWTTFPFIMFLRNIAAKVASVRSRDKVSARSRETSIHGCIFCQRDNKSLNNVMLENATFYVRYDNFPAANGHVEIVPKRHVESLFELSQEEVIQAYSLLCEAEKRLTIEYQPHGYTIGVNEG